MSGLANKKVTGATEATEDEMEQCKISGGSRCQFYKTFFVIDLQIFVLS
jgi:hypothetical protein